MCCVVRGNSWDQSLQITGSLIGASVSSLVCSCHPVGSAVLPFSSVTFCDPSNGDCPCSLGWQGHIVRGVWWGTGASETTAAGLVTVRGAATHTGDCLSRWTSMALARSQGSSDSLKIWWWSGKFHATGGAKMKPYISLKNFCQIAESSKLCLQDFRDGLVHFARWIILLNNRPFMILFISEKWKDRKIADKVSCCCCC